MSEYLSIPARMVPSHVVAKAYEKKVQDNVLIHTYGGIGDLVCSEPAIRYALNKLKRHKYSLISKYPELFEHLSFQDVFNANTDEIDASKYIVFNSYQSPNELFWEYLTHMICHPVDFASISMWRFQLPIEHKEIKLPDFQPENKELRKIIFSNLDDYVFLHAGKHWPSKTLPKEWYNELITEFLRNKFKVALIGKEIGDTSYVDVYPLGCIDLRDKLSLKDLICALKCAKFIFSNDSSPIHIAASGDAFIGFISTIKHPDFLTHWRQGKFGYKTKNFGLDGLWNHSDISPIQLFDVKSDVLPAGLMEKILPRPIDVVKYYASLKNNQ